MLRNLSSLMLLAVLMITLSGISFAQGWGGAKTSMDGNAEVFTVLTLTKNTSLNFGDILSTQAAPTIDPTNATNDANVGQHTSKTAHAAGKFTIAGTAGKDVHVSFPATATLSGPSSSTMTWTLAVSSASADAGVRGGTSYTSGAALTLNASGNYFLWVGGNLGALSGQTPGIYTGTADFVVDYN